VGMRGSRIQAISDELYGEKMDLIVWSEDPAEFISKSLSPAKVSKVVLDREKKKAYVTVPDDMLSLAIGKGGQNVRLSARLTGWHIDVKSESERKKEDEVKVSDIIAQFTELRGVGEKTAKTLVAYGFKSIEDMSRVSEKDLEGVSGIGPATAKKIYDEARNWMKEKKK